MFQVMRKTSIEIAILMDRTAFNENLGGNNPGRMDLSDKDGETIFEFYKKVP
jgi:hypothetical protein